MPWMTWRFISGRPCLGLDVHARQRLAHLRAHGLVHLRGRRGDGQVTQVAREPLLVRRQQQQPLAGLARARRAAQAVGPFTQRTYR